MAIQDTTHSVVGEASLQELEESLRGDVIRPSDPRYDEARAAFEQLGDFTGLERIKGPLRAG